ncbi:MAG: hypothetical protein FJW35_06325 [Acidobacteria bacterium]|nr:hypothetical protein [Acidobacteriota bacterium]
MEYYTYQGAQDKVGRRVRVIIEFGGVQKGATGRVLRASLSPNGHCVEIEWDWPPGPERLVTLVSKTEYEKCLMEV